MSHGLPEKHKKVKIILVLIEMIRVLKTYISDESCVGIWGSDVVVFVELPVGWNIQFVSRVQVGVAPVTSTPTLVKTWEEQIKFHFWQFMFEYRYTYNLSP